MKSRTYSLVVVVAIFVGVLGGLILGSNFDWTKSSEAAGTENGKLPITLGSVEPVSQELLSLQATSKAFVQVAKEVSPAIVTINSLKMVERQSWHPFMNDEFFRRFFQSPESPESKQELRGLGSGVIVNRDGYILTNNHVIEDADEITVSFEKEEYDAKIIGRDPASDLAVIKIEKDDLPTVKLGDSEDLEVGEWVLAIGNPFSNILQKTVTAGIVSAKGRRLDQLGGGSITYQDFIQTDAAINPGNSGGALVNLKGELVGINSAIVGQSNVGIGFAIPISLARNVMEQLINEGRVIRGWLGVAISPIDENVAEALGFKGVKGVEVSQVVEDSPAEKAGVQDGDIILQVNKVNIDDPNDLTNLIASFEPGTKVNLDVWRDGKNKDIVVKLGERPADGALASEESSEDIQSKLGLAIENLTDEMAERYDYQDEEGVLVTDVKQGSPAARERIQRGDLIVSVDRKPVKNVGEFNRLVDNLEENQIVLLRLKRRNMSFFRALRVPKDKE